MSYLRAQLSVARVVIVLMSLVFAAVSASAQVTTGNLQGVVKDPNGAVVAGAAVKITNADTGIVKETVTNDEGFYRVTNLTPGPNYKIEVSATGFTAAAVEKVVVRLATENNVDIGFTQAAGATGTVVVTDEAPLIQSTQSQLAQSYTPEQLTQLPFNGGLVDNLALLTPGVVTPGDTDFTNGVGISANGARGRSNNFQIDGQDNNDNSVAGPSLFISNTEAIGEFQVITNNYSAEFGRNSGAQINTITKPGTNEFHGALFEYHSNSALNASDNLDDRERGNFGFLANNGFSNEFGGLANRRIRGPFRENRFGGALGGPIVHDKAFFFGTYQGDFTRGETVSSGIASGGYTFTPQSALLAQSLGLPGASILTNTGVGGGPAFVQGVGQFFVVPPTVDTNGDGVVDSFDPNTGNAFFNSLFVRTPSGAVLPLQTGEGVRILKSDSTNHQLISRIDWNLTHKDVISGRYIFDDTKNPLATGRFTAGAIFDVPSRNNNLGITYTRTLSNTWVNEARFNFSRLKVDFGDPTGTLPAPGIQFSGTRDLVGNLSSLTFGTQNNLPQSRKVDVYQYQDTVSSTLGNHAVKFGADIRQQKVENFFLPNFLGTYTFQGSTPTLKTASATAGQIPAGTPFVFDNGASRTGFRATAFENLLLARPRTINFARGNPLIHTDQNDFFFFVQDDWRVRPNLTLNLGLRYEYSTQPLNPIIEDVNAREADPSTAIFDPAFPLAFRTTQTIATDKNNFAPRVGFAWSPNFGFGGGRFRDGRTVIRGGFGVAYDPGFFNIVLNTVTAAPFAAAGTVQQTPGGVGSVSFPFLPSTIAQLNTTPGTNGGDPRLFNQTRVDPNLYNPYTLQFNFGVQQELVKNTVLEVRYVGSRIIGQFQTVNANPNVQWLNRAAQCLGLDPGAFSHGNVVGTPAASGAAACLGGGFNNRPGTNGNGRIDPNFGLVRLRTNGANATYHGLQARFDTRFRNDLVLNANYTWSRTIDNASEIFSTFGGGSTVAHSQDPFDTTTGERGLSAFDQRHNFTTNFIYSLPWYRDQKGWVGHALGGYQVSSIIRLASGRAYTPINFFGTYDPTWENTFIGSGALRPFNGNPSAPVGTLAVGNIAAQNLIGPFDLPDSPTGFWIYNTLSPGSQPHPGTLNDARLVYNDFGGFSQFFAGILPLDALESFAHFKTPFGDVGRNTFFGDPFYGVNLALFKTTNLTENLKLEFRVEAANLLNRRNFGVPDPVTEDAYLGGAVGSFQNPGFNNGSQRELRLGLRFIF